MILLPEAETEQLEFTPENVRAVWRPRLVCIAIVGVFALAVMAATTQP